MWMNSFKQEVPQCLLLYSIHCTQCTGTLGMPSDIYIEAIMQVCEPLFLNTSTLQGLQRKTRGIWELYQNCYATRQYFTNPNETSKPLEYHLPSINHHRKSYWKWRFVNWALPLAVKIPSYTPKYKQYYQFLVSSVPSQILGTNEISPSTIPPLWTSSQALH